MSYPVYLIIQAIKLRRISKIRATLPLHTRNWRNGRDRAMYSKNQISKQAVAYEYTYIIYFISRKLFPRDPLSNFFGNGRNRKMSGDMRFMYPRTYIKKS